MSEKEKPKMLTKWHQNFSAFMDDENWRECRRQIWWKEGKLSFIHLKKDDIYFKENEKKQREKSFASCKKKMNWP